MIIPLENIIFIISIWFTTFLVGFISWPSVSFFFHRLSDKGYSLVKILGWVIISYLTFLLTTLKIIHFRLTYLVGIFLIWAGFNLFLNFKFKLIKKEDINWKQIYSIEFCFFILLYFWIWVRSHNPEIQGIERFMDFGFLNSLFQTDTLPLFDFWYLGKSVNYYYFGHFIGYIILSFSHISPIPGFLTLVGWMFAVLGINVYRIGRDVASLIFSNQKVKQTLLKIAGLISFFATVLAGTWYTYDWIFKKLQQLFFGGNSPYFWYPDPTRIIPFTITEMPIYGFLEGDLHPYIWGLIIGVLILATLYALWRDKKFSLNLKNSYLWFISFLLGVVYMTNSWDVFTLGGLSVIVIFFKYYSESKLQFLKIVIFIILLAYLIGLPWSIFFHPPVQGIGIVKKHSPLLPWISFWGSIISLIILFLFRLSWQIWKTKKWKLAISFEYGFHTVLIITTIFFLLFMELFYIKDLFQGGDYFRVNTVFKISNQLWLWIGIISGSIIVWLMSSLKNRKLKISLLIIMVLIFLGPAVYSFKAIWQARLENKKPATLSSSLNWWKEKYPYDYEAYLFLEKVKQSLPENDKIRNIVEVDGESFTDDNRFSTFLGWPTIIGWPIHEWTWRGNYEVVGSRKEEVKEIYTGEDKIKTENTLKKYKINYIIVGEAERERYKDQINLDKLLSLGKAIFRNEKTIIISL